MKKLFLLCTLSLGMFVSQGLAADDYSGAAAGQAYDYSGDQGYAAGYSGGCAQGGCAVGGDDYAAGGQPEDVCCGQPQERPCGNWYCLYCKYEPCYYNSYRTVQVAHPCKKKCWRYVPKYTDKCCVKYVPQYYTQTSCKYVPECYYVDECTYSTKKVCDRKVKWVPKYYYKCVKGAPAAASNACGVNACDPCAQ